MSFKIQTLKNILANYFKRHWGHFLSIIIIVLFSQIVVYESIYETDTKRLSRDDIQQYHLRTRFVNDAMKKYNTVPLWNSNLFSGMPIIMNPPHFRSNILSRNFVGVYYERTILHRMLSNEAALYIAICLGMYLFILSMGVKWYSALLGSILYGFTTNIIGIIGAGHALKFQALTIIPWIFWGVNIIVNWANNNVKWNTNLRYLMFGLIVLASAGATAIYSRHPQILYIYIFLLLPWLIYESYQLIKLKKIPQWITISITMMIAGSIAITCSMGYLWQVRDYTQYSMRGGSAVDTKASTGLSKEYAFNWSYSVPESLSLFMPELYGGSSKQAYWGGRPHSHAPHYIGGLTLLLIIIAWFWWKNKGKLTLLTGIAILCIIFSMGSNFPFINDFLHSYVPMANRFRAPETWIYVTVFCTSILAAYGFQALVNNVPKIKKKAKHVKLPKPLYVAIGITLGIGLIFSLFTNSLLSYQKTGEFQSYVNQVARQNQLPTTDRRVVQSVQRYMDTNIKPKREALAVNSAITFFIINAIASILIVLVFYKQWSSYWFIIGILVLTSWDMLSITRQYTLEYIIEKKTFNNNVFNFEREDKAHLRYIRDHIDSGLGYPYRAFPVSENPFNNNESTAYFPSIGGYSAAKLSIYQDFISYILYNDPVYGLNQRTLSMLNTKYMTIKGAFPGWKEVFSYNDIKVLENPNVLPKAFFVDNIKVVSTPQQAINSINDNTFDPAKIAIVEHYEPLSNSIASNNEKIEIVNYQPNLITLSVERDKPGFLVLSEIYYPHGWHAKLNGEDIPTYKTNYILRGYEIPAGKHELELTYMTPAQKYGGMVTNIGRTVLMILFFGYILYVLYHYLRPYISQLIFANKNVNASEN